MAKGKTQKPANGSNLDFEAQLWAVADKMRGCIGTNHGPRNADSFRADLHSDLKADFMPVWNDLANPPFNISDWGGENLRSDVLWKFGMPR